MFYPQRAYPRPAQFKSITPLHAGKCQENIKNLLENLIMRFQEYDK
jgi:hypothetical protein